MSSNILGLYVQLLLDSFEKWNNNVTLYTYAEFQYLRGTFLENKYKNDNNKVLSNLLNLFRFFLTNKIWMCNYHE